MLWGEKGARGGNSGHRVQLGHSTWLSGLLESRLCLHPALLLEGVWWDPPGTTGLSQGGDTEALQSDKWKTGGDGRQLCSALRQLPVPPGREGSVAQRLSCICPMGPGQSWGSSSSCSFILAFPLLNSEQAWWSPPAPSTEELQRSQRRYRSICCFSQHTSQHQELTLEAV